MKRMRTKWMAMSSVFLVLSLLLVTVLPASIAGAEESASGNIAEAIADPDTSDMYVDYFDDIDVSPRFWSDKSVTANEDGSMSVVYSLMVRNSVTEDETMLSVLNQESDVEIKDVIGKGFELGSDIVIRNEDGVFTAQKDEFNVTSEMGDDSEAVPSVSYDYDTKEIVVNMRATSIGNIDNGSCTTIAFSLVPNPEEFESGILEYYADGNSVVTGLLSDGVVLESEILEKSEDVTGLTSLYKTREVFDGYVVDTIYNTGKIALAEPESEPELESESETESESESEYGLELESVPEPEPAPEATYTETYAYDQEYPEDIMATLPNRSDSYNIGATVYPAEPFVTMLAGEMDGLPGTWSFNGWAPESVEIVDADAAFIGSWSFTASEIPVSQYSILYQYDGEYPEEVLSTLPTDENLYDDGLTVTPSEPFATSVSVTDDDVSGVWTFNGWDAESKVITGANVTFVGTWTFVQEAAPLYGESYSYDREYPDVVMSTLPISTAEYPAGVDVYPADPLNTSVEDVVNGMSGKWIFVGWDKPYKTIVDAPVSFVGSWTWEEDAIIVYGESYRYDGEYPEAVMNTLPSRHDTYQNGVEVFPLDPSETTVVGEKDGNAGKWTFDGWNATSKVVDGADVEFVGTWTFTADAPPVVMTYTEYYRYEGSLPENVIATLPTRHNSYSNGSPVTPAAPSATTVEGTNGSETGKWTFNGWDAEVKTVTDADVEFVGTWKFTANPLEPPVVTKYTEQYRYDGDVPSAVASTLPTRHGEYEDGVEVVPANPTATSVIAPKDGKKGTWNFVGWDAKSKFISGADVTFVGTWNFVPDEEPDPGVVVNVTKTWVDYNNGTKTRPQSINISLCADNIVLKTATLSENNGWKTTFKDLPSVKNGKTVQYTIKEESVPGYKSEIKTTVIGGAVAQNEDGTTSTSATVYNYDITNTLEGNSIMPETGSLTAILLGIGGGIIVIGGVIWFIISKKKDDEEDDD